MKDPTDTQTPDLLTETLGAPEPAHAVSTAAGEKVLLEVMDLERKRGNALKVRAILRFWHPGKEYYVSWPGRSWGIELRTPHEAEAFAAALDTLFDCLSVAHVNVVLPKLRGLHAELLNDRR